MDGGRAIRFRTRGASWNNQAGRVWEILSVGGENTSAVAFSDGLEVNPASLRGSAAGGSTEAGPDRPQGHDSAAPSEEIGTDVSVAIVRGRNRLCRFSGLAQAARDADVILAPHPRPHPLLGPSPASHSAPAVHTPTGLQGRNRRLQPSPFQNLAVLAQHAPDTCFRVHLDAKISGLVAGDLDGRCG